MFIKNGFVVTDYSDNVKSDDLVKSDDFIFDKIKTEYENKFIELGLDIYRLVAVKK